jgi:preprotein translocase subunit SecA
MLRGLFKTSTSGFNKREIARLQKVVEEINVLEPALEALDDAALRARTDDFRRRLAQGETLGDILVEAFAAVREAAKRTVGLRHYDVQMIGGMVLHRGDIAEMRTGEGKTLVATLPLYLNALEGKGVHLVTPNDYLSKVGVQWMGPVYHALGLSVGVIQSAAANPDEGSFVFDANYPSADDRLLNLRPVTRHEAYHADVTYGTNNEFGFDYLRDNMVRDLSQCVQPVREGSPGLYYAIIDEVDNILIDEARTPLIISGPAEESSELYSRFADMVRRLRPSSPQSIEAEEPDGDYVLEVKTRIVTLTERGVERVESMVPEVGAGQSIYDAEHAHMLPYLDNALRAFVTYKRDKDYIVSGDGEVIIVDEFTGRLMHGRRFSEGLHQAIEAKEGVEVRRESLTYATITFQNYFRMYDKLAGMTGTAKTEEEEFQRIYNLDVVVLPTNVEYRSVYGDLSAQEQPVDEIEDVSFAGVLDGRTESLGMPAPGPVKVTTYEPENGSGRRYYKRLDLSDHIYATEKGKFQAVVDEIDALYKAERPVLVGTIAIETSERLSRMLKRRGISHQVLNAKYHEKEAVIIAQAGQSGAVTLATNMAGRGVDVKLGGDPEGVARERLRKEGIDLAEIPQTDWNHALEKLRKGQDITSIYPARWAQVLAGAAADCAADRARVLAKGGLHILGTERHEARRIDNQLRGRSGRQGDPGSSRFYISLEDDLMHRFGGERVQSLMGRLGVDEGIPIQHSWLDKSIESAQMRVEGYNFDIRKHVLAYDDVVNKQREVIYAQRREVLGADDLRDQVLRMVEEEVSALVVSHVLGSNPDDRDLQGLYGELRSFFPLPSGFSYRAWEKLSSDDIVARLMEIAERAYDEVNGRIGRDVFRQATREDVTLESLARSVDPAHRLVYRRVAERLWENPEGADEAVTTQPIRRLPDETKGEIEAAFVDAYRLVRDRQLMLQAVDGLWVRHLTNLDELREGIRLRAYGQQDPLVAYRKEAFEMYEVLLGRIQETVARSIFLVPQELAIKPRQRQLRAVRPGTPGQGARRASQPVSKSSGEQSGRSLGRNDPCWCGSGKKYKQCHLRQDQSGQGRPDAQAGQATSSRASKGSGKKQRRRR